jgi:hypothetical protein
MSTTFGAESTTDQVLAGIDLTGKRVLVTGASAGLGIETARALAAHGAQVVGAVRDLAKGEGATAQVRAAAAQGGGSFELVALDLADLTSVRACADALLAKGEAFDLIIANAGVMATPFGKTADGFETQFGTNHLGHFVLINRLAPLLRAGSRVISLSSSGHRFSDVNLEDPNFERTDHDGDEMLRRRDAMARRRCGQIGGGLLSFPVTHFDAQHQFVEAPYREHCAWMLEHELAGLFAAAARASSSR